MVSIRRYLLFMDMVSEGDEEEEAARKRRLVVNKKQENNKHTEGVRRHFLLSASELSGVSSSLHSTSSHVLYLWQVQCYSIHVHIK